jgi:hypothetical protein
VDVSLAGYQAKNNLLLSFRDRSVLAHVSRQLNVWANISCVANGVKLSGQKQGRLLILRAGGDRFAPVTITIDFNFYNWKSEDT